MQAGGWQWLGTGLGYPSSSGSYESSVSELTSGSSSKDGWGGGSLGTPVRLKAPDVFKNSVRARMPSLVPSIVGSVTVLDISSRSLCWEKSRDLRRRGLGDTCKALHVLTYLLIQC